MKKYTSFIAMLLLVTNLFTGCKEDDAELGPTPTPSDVKFSFTPDASNPNILHFKSEAPGFLSKWDFGNGASGQGTQVNGEYPLEGEYTVTLTIFTSGGFTSSTKVVTIANTNYLMLNRADYNFLTGGASKLEGKTWVIDKEGFGHLGVGPAASASPEWYQAGPNDKASEGYYDDEMTFKLNGLGYSYSNKGGTFSNGANAAGIGGNTAASDYTVPYTPKTSLTWNITEEGGKQYLSISDGGFIGYFAGVSKYEILKLEENELYIRSLDGANTANAWYQRLVPKGFVRPKPVKPYKADNVFDSFDTDGNIVWKVDNLVFTDVYDNPAPVPVNTSAKVALYRKEAGPAKEFANLFTDFAYKMDLTQRHVFKLKVLMPSYNDYTTEAGEEWAIKTLLKQVSVKLQDSEAAQPWVNQVEIKQSVTKLGEWVELTFDFSGAADRKDLDRIVIQIGGEGHFNAGVFFIDDFRLE